MWGLRVKRWPHIYFFCGGFRRLGKHAAHLFPMTIHNALDHPRIDDGTFTTKDQSAPELTVSLMQSSFIDSSVTTAEAAARYVTENPDATTADFEDSLFDTYDTVEQFEADQKDPESELILMSDRLMVFQLPSGGLAVHWG
jgi:hypothetical protein